MSRNLIEHSVNGIEFAEESRQRILEGIKKNKKSNDKGYFSKWSFRIAVVVVLSLVFLNIIPESTNKTVLTVYSMTKDSNELTSVLPLNQEVTLKLMKTPVGDGYIFKVDIPDGYTYESKAIGKMNNIFTVYQKDKNIYWIPNQDIIGNIYSRKNDKLLSENFQAKSECQFEILIYNERREILEKRVVKFKIVNGKCKATLKK